jgi:hypothetical protein
MYSKQQIQTGERAHRQGGMVAAFTAKLPWVRDPGVPAGEVADGSYTCVCGAVTGGQPFSGPEWTCAGCGRVWDGRGWAVSGPAADWAITEADGSVADRFTTEREAGETLAQGGYPPGCSVERVPDPEATS